MQTCPQSPGHFHLGRTTWPSTTLQVSETNLPYSSMALRTGIAIQVTTSSCPTIAKHKQIPGSTGPCSTSLKQLAFLGDPNALTSLRTLNSQSTRPKAAGAVKVFAIQQQDSRSIKTGQEGERAVPGVRDTVWDQKQLAVPSNPKLDRDLHAEVVVVGAGIAGLSVAYNLAKAGKKVVVLEGRAIGSGQTGKTTAHLMPWFDDYYYLLEQEKGTETIALVGESHRGAIKFIKDTVDAEGIECNFKYVEGYLVPYEDTEEEAQKIRQEYEASKRAGFTDVRLENLRHDPKNGTFGMALVFPQAGEFQPLLYIKGLAKAIKEKGGKIYELTSVVKNEGTRLETSTGHTVTADAVVLATNSPINKNLAVHARQYARRSYVVGLRVNKGDINRASWWDTASPYHYVRLEDKGDSEILIVGGEDHLTGISPKDYDDTFGKLESWARQHWPAAKEVVYRWTGQVYMPNDHIGLYGHDPLNADNVYIASGDSGEGMTGGTIAGIVISEAILGRSHPWVGLYNPSRLPPPTGTTLQSTLTEVAENIEGFKNVLPLQGVDALSAQNIANGSGAVIQEALDTVAVYKDDSGFVHRYSAICPHLGCAVKWNPKDSTFDCPCHGSQFDTQGVCVNGPAKANLDPISYN